MKITILRRYDINGASCPDFDVEMGVVEPNEDSMWRAVEVVDIDELQKKAEAYDNLVKHLSYNGIH